MPAADKHQSMENSHKGGSSTASVLFHGGLGRMGTSREVNPDTPYLQHMYDTSYAWRSEIKSTATCAQQSTGDARSVAIYCC